MSEKPTGWPDPDGRIAAAIARVAPGEQVSHRDVAAAASADLEDAKATAVMLLLRGDLRCKFVAFHGACDGRLGPERSTTDEAEADVVLAASATCPSCGAAGLGADVRVLFYAHEAPSVSATAARSSDG